MSHPLEDFDPASVQSHRAGLYTPETPVVHAADYEKLLALYEMTVNRADASEKKLQHLQAEIESPQFYMRAINCPHTIDASQVVLHFDSKQPGHNALNQLSRRLTIKPKALTPIEDDPLRLPPPERQQLWILIDEALRDHMGPFERGDVCNILAPLLAPQVISKPGQAGLILTQTLRDELDWLDVPVNYEAIRLYALRYRYLRDQAGNERGKRPMVVMLNEKDELLYESVLDSLSYAKQLDHRIDRCLFPEEHASEHVSA